MRNSQKELLYFSVQQLLFRGKMGEHYFGRQQEEKSYDHSGT